MCRLSQLSDSAAQLGWPRRKLLILAGLAIGSAFWLPLHAKSAKAFPEPELSAKTTQWATSTVAIPKNEKKPPRRHSTAASKVKPQPGESTTSLQMRRKSAEPDADLLRGQAHLQRLELDLARADFEQVRQRDPNNVDALLALAAIARHQKHHADAEHLIRQAFVAAPNDPSVQAALLNSALALADPQSAESRLRSLLATQAESAALNFSLGNLLARQQRWPEAQLAYFNAVAVEGDNPDYLFNLAVSLEHIRQYRPAAHYYQLALDASTRQPAAFAPNLAQMRLHELRAEPRPQPR